MLSKRWGMVRWVNKFIKKNQDGKRCQKGIKDWQKMRRLEKIQHLKRNGEQGGNINRSKGKERENKNHI